MKKIIGILVIMITMFIGINSVGAEDRGTYIGSCTIDEKSNTMCNYKCKVSDDSDHFLEFGYTANVSTSESLTHEVSFISNDGDCDVFGNYPGCGYIGFELVLKNHPVMGQFVLNNQFNCPPVIPTVNVSYEIWNEYNIPGASIWAMVNYISIDVDETYTPENRPGYKPEEVDTSCGLLGGQDSEVVIFLQKIYKYIKIFLPVLIVVFGIADFIKIIGTGKDDDMKKAISKFAKRIVIAVIFIFVPMFISIIINVSGLTSQHSGINDGLKAVFCVIK